MAKKKEDYLKEAQDLGLDVTAKNTVAEIQEAIKNASQAAPADTEAPAKESTEVEESDEEEKFAKAGKRSKKAVEEAEALKEKEDRKAKIASGETEAAEPKRGPVPKARPLIERRGKKYRQAAEKIDKSKTYTIAEASKLAVETSTTKFDATVEIHARLNLDPTQADQNVRGTTSLPHGTGKSQRVAVFAPGEDHKAATEAGADVVGEDDFLEKLKKEELDFDVLISTPQMMAQLGRFAKLLGPKGLMPNPKSGTVTKNVAQAVKEAKAGKVEFRIDKQANAHIGIGKVSFGPEKVAENATTILAAIKAARPASIKGSYIENVSMTTSMGPSIRIDLADVNAIKS